MGEAKEPVDLSLLKEANTWHQKTDDHCGHGYYVDAEKCGYCVALATIFQGVRDAARSEEREKLLHTGKPWPLADVVNVLAGATRHLMLEHDCDRHGYERVMAAVEAAEVWLLERDSAPVPAEPSGEQLLHEGHKSIERAKWQSDMEAIEGMLMEIVEDSLGDDAPINRGLDSIEAADRWLRRRGSIPVTSEPPKTEEKAPARSGMLDVGAAGTCDHDIPFTENCDWCKS